MKKGLNIFRNKKDLSIELVPQKSHFSLIWLHGLGDGSEGFLDYLQMPQSPLHYGARVKLLQAPSRPVSINGGMKSNSWYDIKMSNLMTSDKQRYSLEEIQQSRITLDKHVQEQLKSWQQKYKNQTSQQTYKRIFIGGFSQGCAISLLYALTCDNLLGGMIGYSGYVFKSFDLKNKDKLPMLMYHGTDDTVIGCKSAKKGYEMMIGQRQLSIYERPNFQLKLIPHLGHSVQLEQLSQTTSWIKKVLKENKVQQ